VIRDRASKSFSIIYKRLSIDLYRSHIKRFIKIIVSNLIEVSSLDFSIGQTMFIIEELKSSFSSTNVLPRNIVNIVQGLSKLLFYSCAGIRGCLHSNGGNMLKVVLQFTLPGISKMKGRQATSTDQGQSHNGEGAGTSHNRDNKITTKRKRLGGVSSDAEPELGEDNVCVSVPVHYLNERDAIMDSVESVCRRSGFISVSGQVALYLIDLLAYHLRPANFSELWTQVVDHLGHLLKVWRGLPARAGSDPILTDNEAPLRYLTGSTVYAMELSSKLITAHGGRALKDLVVVERLGSVIVQAHVDILEHLFSTCAAHDCAPVLTRSCVCTLRDLCTSALWRHSALLRDKLPLLLSVLLTGGGGEVGTQLSTLHTLVQDLVLGASTDRRSQMMELLLPLLLDKLSEVMHRSGSAGESLEMWTMLNSLLYSVRDIREDARGAVDGRAADEAAARLGVRHDTGGVVGTVRTVREDNRNYHQWSDSEDETVAVGEEEWQSDEGEEEGVPQRVPTLFNDEKLRPIFQRLLLLCTDKLLRVVDSANVDSPGASELIRGEGHEVAVLVESCTRWLLDNDNCRFLLENQDRRGGQEEEEESALVLARANLQLLKEFTEKVLTRLSGAHVSTNVTAEEFTASFEPFPIPLMIRLLSVTTAFITCWNVSAIEDHAVAKGKLKQQSDKLYIQRVARFLARVLTLTGNPSIAAMSLLFELLERQRGTSSSRGPHESPIALLDPSLRAQLFDTLAGCLTCPSYWVRMCALKIASFFPPVALLPPGQKKLETKEEGGMEMVEAENDPGQPDEVVDVVQWCIDAACTTPALQLEREFSRKVGKLEVLLRFNRLPSEYIRFVCSFCIGALYTKFQPFWEPLVLALVAASESVRSQDTMWPLMLSSIQLLGRTPLVVLSTQDDIGDVDLEKRLGDEAAAFEGSAVAELFDRDEGHLPLSAATAHSFVFYFKVQPSAATEFVYQDSRTDTETLYANVWEVLRRSPSITLRKSRTVVPLFLW